MGERAVATARQPFEYSLSLPGSKSIALRQLALSALATSRTQITGFAGSDDHIAMQSALEQLGVKFTKISDDVLDIDPSTLDLTSDQVIDLNMSGVSLRIMCAIAALRTGTTKLTGHPSLAARPNQHLLEALESLGCVVDSNGGKLPISIKGIASPRTSQIKLNSSVSSQYLSALLLVGSRMPEGLRVECTGNIASSSYVSLTLGELAKRGVSVEKDGNTYSLMHAPINGGSISIEGDASALSYHAALAALHASTVHIENLGSSTKQGDFTFLDVCQELGARVDARTNTTTIRGKRRLVPLADVDFQSMPDTAPTYMAIAPFLNDPTTLTGLETLPDKECDRIECPAQNLRQAGIEVKTSTSTMTIYPSDRKPARFETFDDHRMAMAFAVYSSKATGCSILNPECVSKTYPNFWQDFERIYT